MKPQALFLPSLALVAAVLFVLTSCSSPSPPTPAVGSANIAYTKGVPGGVVAQTFKINASVVALDRAQRTATLQGPSGKKFTLKIAPAAVNFQQIRVGDTVAATVTQKVDISLDDHPAASASAVSPKGGQAAEPATLTASLMAIDYGKRTVTVRFEDGSAETRAVRSDVDLSRHKVGDQVLFRVLEMTALWVEKSP